MLSDGGNSPVTDRRAWLAALATGLLFFLAFPPVQLGWIAHLALVPLIAVLGGCSDRRAFALGWVAGTVGCSALVSPSIATAAASYFDLPRWADIGFALIAPQIYGAPYVGLFALCANRLLRHPRSTPAQTLLLASAWVACEWVRSHLWHGAPWILLAHSQYGYLPLLQIADAGGSAAIGFVVAATNAGVALALRTSPRSALAALTTALAVLGSSMVYGIYAMRSIATAPQQASLRVAIVQGNIPEEWRATLPGNRDSLDRHLSLTRHALPENPDLIVWPENAVGFFLNANPSLFAEATRELPPSAALVLGAPRVVDEGDGHATFRNSAHLVDARGQLLRSYDKIRLTPYAEYAPLPDWLRSPQKAEYKPGSEPALFEASGVPFGVMICFEAIYADLGREFVQRGARFLVNISNDDWFHGRAAIEQHFAASMLRAIEARRYLLRVTNTGVSAVVDPRGAIVARLDERVAQQKVVEIVPSDVQTLYTRWGDWFAWLTCLALAVALRQRPGRTNSRT